MIKAKTKVGCEKCLEKSIHYPKVKELHVKSKKKSIDEWYQMMYNLGEADDPYITVEGIVYTPTEIKAEYDDQSETWFKIKKRMI